MVSYIYGETQVTEAPFDDRQKRSVRRTLRLGAWFSYFS